MHEYRPYAVLEIGQLSEAFVVYVFGQDIKDHTQTKDLTFYKLSDTVKE